MKILIQKAGDKRKFNITQLIEAATLSGTQVQASRRLEFSLVFSPFDDDFNSFDIKNGDKVFFTDGDESFIGRIIKSENPSQPGVRSFAALDFMNLLLKNKKPYSFKNKSPEQIAKKIIEDNGLLPGDIAKTKVNIKKWIVTDETGYNIILGAYQIAHRKNKKKYRLCMDGVKVCVKEMNEHSGVTLTQGDSVLSAIISDNAEDIVNRVYIVNDKNKIVGKVEDKASIKLFGVYSDTYKKEEGANAKEAAKALLKAPTKEIGPLEAVGDIRCTSGKSVYIKDETSGLIGKFYITEDTHTYSGGTHTMSLKLSFDKIMEGYGSTDKKVATPDAVCYYSESAKKYHSAKKCGSGLSKAIKSTVSEAEKTGREKCSMCWN